MKKKYIEVRFLDHGRERVKTLYVNQKSENIYAMVENDIHDFNMSYGTEFETKIFEDGSHEIVKITEESEWHTRRFSLNPKYPFSLFEKLRKGFRERGWLWEEKHYSGFLSVPSQKKDKIDEAIKELIGRLLPEIIDPDKISPFENKKKVESRRIVARFPNGLIQVEIQENNIGENKYLILDELGKPIVEELFSGIVYLERNKFEVYKNSNDLSGILDTRTGVNWELETPREELNKAYSIFREEMNKELDCIAPNCICSYPRIIDYLTERSSIDAELIRAEVDRRFFIQFNREYDKRTESHILFYKCRNCGSSYKRRYRERGIDQLEVVNLTVEKSVGKKNKTLAPTYLTALYGKLFYRQSYLGRKKLFSATLNEVMVYLFEKNE